MRSNKNAPLFSPWVALRELKDSRSEDWHVIIPSLNGQSKSGHVCTRRVRVGVRKWTLRPRVGACDGHNQEYRVTNFIMSLPSGGSGINITFLPLSDPRCNSEVCLAFKKAGDASQAEIPFASQFVYGQYTVYYFSTFVIIFSILYWHRRLSAAYEEFPEPRTTISQRTKALWRFIKYRRLWIGMSFGHAMFIGVAILVTTVLTFLQRPYFRPRLSYGSPPIGVRTGVMALACTPAIVVLSGKYNLITLMTGISYERLNLLHRYLGYICLGLGVVHSIAFAIAIYGDSNYWPLFENFGSAEVRYPLICVIASDGCLLGNSTPDSQS